MSEIIQSPTYSFSEIIGFLKEGKLVSREVWNNGKFVVKQIPAIIGSEVIPNMQSLPQSAKDKLLKTFNQTIYYRNQLLLIQSDGTADSWSPSAADIFAEDWIVFE